jgi:hypothetical protein
MRAHALIQGFLHDNCGLCSGRYKVKCRSGGTEDAIYHQQIEILSSPGISWTIHFSAELFSTAQAQALFPSTILGKKTHILA